MDATEPLAALKSADSWNFAHNKHPKCPHCGEDANIDRNEWWHLYEEGEQEVECPNALCERQFTVSTHVQYSFSTDEQEETGARESLPA